MTPLVVRLHGWIQDFELGWVKYVVGFLIAVTVAVRETGRYLKAKSPDAC